VPVYLFTFHAYRSWRPDDPRGYVRRKQGVLPPDPEMAGRYDRHAVQATTCFECTHQRIIVEGARDVCMRRSWRLHAIATDPSHVHALVSWKEASGVCPSKVVSTLKQVLGYLLARESGIECRKWFSRGSSQRRVTRHDHFEHLLSQYLPGHRGIKWSERDGES